MDLIPMSIIICLSIIGAITAFGADDCAGRSPDTKLFGKIPWSLIGFVGYMALIITIRFPHVTYILVGIMALVTLWLVIKAQRISLSCGACSTIWALNVIIICVTILSLVVKQK